MHLKAFAYKHKNSSFILNPGKRTGKAPHRLPGLIIDFRN